MKKFSIIMALLLSGCYNMYQPYSGGYSVLGPGSPVVLVYEPYGYRGGYESYGGHGGKHKFSGHNYKHKSWKYPSRRHLYEYSGYGRIGGYTTNGVYIGKVW